MTPLARLLILLYPRSWRARYGEELEALIEDANTRPTDVLDLFTGALKMQLTNWKFPIGLALAGLALATIAAELVPKIYLAETSVRSDTGNHVAIVRKAMNGSALVEIIHAEGLYSEESARMPLEEIVEQLNRNLRISAPGPDGVMKVYFQHSDSAIAQRAAHRLAASLAVPGPVTASVVFPNHRSLQIIGLGIGLLSGLAIVMRRRRPA